MFHVSLIEASNKKTTRLGTILMCVIPVVLSQNTMYKIMCIFT